MRKLRAIGALLVLLALLAGVPAALAGTIGNPLTGLPDLLAGDVSDAALISVLATVAWVAWAQFALATIAELAAAARRVPLPRRIPGVLSGQQHLARSLVMAAFMLGPVTASTLLSPAGFTTLPPTTPVSVETSPAANTAPAGPVHAAPEPAGQAATADVGTSVYTIPSGAGPATLWDIAQTHLGSGERWQEIWQLNEGRTQPDGAVMTSPRRLLPGWTVLVPTGTAAAAAAATGTTEVTVEPGDTLAELAQEHGLADWQPTWQANAGRAQPDGSTFTDPDLIRPGWQLSIPTATPTEQAPAAVSGGDQTAREHIVSPGETLSQIAAEQLGNVDAAEQLWQANRGRPQPDGATMSDPDLIRPGWSITLPGVGAAAPVTATALEEVTAPAESQPGTERAPQAPLAAPAAPAEPDPVLPAEQAAAAPVAPSVPASPPASAPDVPRTAGDRAAAAEPDVDADAGADSEAPEEGQGLSAVAFAGGGTLAAVLLGALVAMRRQRFRERRLGATIGTTPPELAAMEKALLTGNAQAVADVQFLHDALASLLRSLDGAELPDVVAVRLSAEVMELVQSAERRDAPEPWRVDETGLRWSISTDADLSSAGEPAPAELAPYPALVTVGYTDAGEHWLVDLERVGAVSLTGDPERCLDLARYVAAELAHNRWSEQLQVSVVGFGAELAELNPSRILYRPNTTVAVAGLRATLSEHSQVLAESSSTVLAGRARLDLPGDGWAPHVLLVAPDAAAGEADPAELVALLEAMRVQRSRAAVAIVLAGDDTHAADTRWTLHVDETGRLSIPALDVELIAHRLPAPEALQLGALLARTADAPDVSEPPARGDQPWDALADAAGAPLCELTEQRPADERALKAAQDPDEDVEPVASVLPMPASTYVSVTATTSVDVEQLAPGVGAAVRRRVETADPDLDADLAAWHDPDSGIAKLALLGPVSLVGAGPAPAKRAAFLTEMVCYLAARPQCVSPAQLTGDFWPGADDTGTGRKMISKVRTWLGRDPRTGALYVPMARDAGAFGSYGVTGLPVDSDLFRRLRLRGVTRGPDGISDLWAALELVRGVPLLELQAKGSGWLVDTPLHHELTAGIVDVAHLVATHHLAAGEPAEAERAARVALLAGAPDDVPLLDLIAACDADGRHAEADSHVRQLLANNEVDIVEELQPRTFEVLRRRSYLPQEPIRAEAGG